MRNDASMIMVFDDGEMISTKLMLSHFVVDIVSISIGKCIHLYGSKGYTIKQKDKPLIAKMNEQRFWCIDTNERSKGENPIKYICSF